VTIRLSETEINALRITVMMADEGKATYMPSHLAVELRDKGLVSLVESDWHRDSFGAEHVVTITEKGRAALVLAG